MDFWFMRKNEVFQSYPAHSHGYWEVMLNLSGTGILTADGQSYPFSPSSIFCIRPGVKHQKRSDEGFKDATILIRDFCFDPFPDKVLCFQDDEQSSFRTLYELAASVRVDPTRDMFTVRYLRSILDAIQNLLCSWKDQGQLNPEVARVQQLLYQNAADPDFDLCTVVDHTNYSPSHFRSLFREQSGCTPTQYLKHMRIQMAKQLLLQEGEQLSMGEVAERCGFKDPYYFSRVFKQLAGVNPSQFCRESQALDPEHLATDLPAALYPYHPDKQKKSRI